MHVIFSEATGDVTVYSYGIDENERVTGVFENPTRHAQRYAIPTDAQLRSREYAKGKPIWNMKKDERIRILTAIALNHMAYHMKGKDIPIDIHNHGDMFPTIGEYPFKFIDYSWIPEKYLPVTTDEIPGWVRADDILHVVTIYYKEWQTCRTAVARTCKALYNRPKAEGDKMRSGCTGCGRAVYQGKGMTGKGCHIRRETLRILP